MISKNSKLIDIAKNTLGIESKALLNYQERISDEFSHVVYCINQCEGNILFSGIGKSGIVAQKIASTFNSIGRTSIFLHPIEALHGDLGIVKSKDVLIILSKSGETEELFSLVGHMKKKGVKVIAITGNKNSTLGRLSLFVLEYNVLKESTPINVVPTTSLVLSMAIGDALAACLIHINQIKIDDFARLHPGGAIGRAYSLKVRDIMHSGEMNPKLLLSASVEDVVTTITEKRMGAVNIVDEKNRLLGIITDGDLRRALTYKERFFDLTIEEIMTADPVVAFEDELAIKALDLIENRDSQLSVLPVLDSDKKNIGIVRVHDIVKAGL